MAVCPSCAELAHIRRAGDQQCRHVYDDGTQGRLFDRPRYVMAIHEGPDGKRCPGSGKERT